MPVWCLPPRLSPDSIAELETSSTLTSLKHLTAAGGNSDSPAGSPEDAPAGSPGAAAGSPGGAPAPAPQSSVLAAGKSAAALFAAAAIGATLLLA